MTRTITSSAPRAFALVLLGLLVGPSAISEHGGSISVFSVWCELGELERTDVTAGGALPELPVLTREDLPSTGGTDRAFGTPRPRTSGVTP